MRTKLFFFAGALLAVVGGVVAGPVELEPKETAASPTITDSNHWYFNLGMPGWLAWMSGDIGLHGTNSTVSVPFDQILTHVAGIATISAEARKGRFGAYGDLLYMSLSDGIYGSGLVKKANLTLDQYIADGEIYYRVLEGPSGWLDLRAGARYTNMFNRLEPTSADSKIDQAATDLVNAANDHLRGLLDRLLKGALDNRNPPLPVPPLGVEEKIKLLKLIREARQDPMTAHRRITRILKTQLKRSSLGVGAPPVTKIQAWTSISTQYCDRESRGPPPMRQPAYFEDYILYTR